MTNKSLKKKCQDCQKDKAVRFFYKVNSNMFPDGTINICNTCIRNSIDINDIEQVINFLRQIDKPYIESYWKESLQSENYPLGDYIRKTNSLSQLKDKTFADSDGFNGYGKIDVYHNEDINTIETEDGEIIEFDTKLAVKWGSGYKKEEYLAMEKYYRDMTKTHEIKTPAHIDMLRQLSYLSVDRDRLRQQNNWNDYTKVSTTMKELIATAGFTPANLKSGAEASGLDSFSQTWAKIERDGWIPPKLIEYPKDDIDYMLLYYIQFSQRFVGHSASSQPPENWRDEVYEEEINDT